MSCTCTCVGTCTCATLPSVAVQVPSPEPPWRRPSQIVAYEVLRTPGNISLTANPTMLLQTLNSPSVPVAMALPNGNQVGQIKTILIATADRANSETFIVTGTLNEFTSLQFDAVGYMAVLMWDGSGWTLIGGNATTVL